MAAEYKDYYKTLGVSKTATEKEIKSAYRKLARKYHPDVNPDDKASEERFKEVSEAYEALSDPEKRKKYDQFGSQWEQYEHAGGQWPPGGGAQGGNFGGFQFDFGGFGGQQQRYDVGGGSGFSDFFEMLFGGGGMPGGPGGHSGQRRQHRAEDSEAEIEISLDDAFHGTKKAINVDGKRIQVTIPKGVKEGQKIRLSKQGTSGGDLLLKVKMRAHPVFERKENDLYEDLPVDYLTCALGGDVSIPTLSGRLTMKIPPGTTAGKTFRLAGQGMPILKDTKRGDLYARVRVQLPEKLSDQESELLSKIKELRQKEAK